MSVSRCRTILLDYTPLQNRSGRINRYLRRGRWSEEEIVTAITKGQRPDGRKLAAIMPWHAFAILTPEDSGAIVAFLKSLPPVKNKVPGPFGPSEKPTSFVMKIVPPEGATGGSAPKYSGAMAASGTVYGPAVRRKRMSSSCR